jgi:nucleoid-associated protein YgaU
MADEKPVENEFTQYHVVVKGDTLSKIAEQYYGDEMLYKKIFEANRDVIKNPDLIQIGWKLRIP